ELLYDARAAVLDEDVVARHHPQQQVATLGVGQVARDAALVAVVVLEVLGEAVHAYAASGVTAARRLDLDDVGPQPAKHLRTRGPRLVLRHIKDAYTLQSAHGHSPPTVARS